MLQFRSDPELHPDPLFLGMDPQNCYYFLLHGIQTCFCGITKESREKNSYTFRDLKRVVVPFHCSFYYFYYIFTEDVNLDTGVYIFLFDLPPRPPGGGGHKYGQITCRGKKIIERE